jgi:hypothetical protein
MIGPSMPKRITPDDTLPSSTGAYKDLKRTMTLIANAIPDMFHYLDAPNIHSKTNCLESFVQDSKLISGAIAVFLKHIKNPICGGPAISKTAPLFE